MDKKGAKTELVKDTEPRKVVLSETDQLKLEVLRLKVANFDLAVQKLQQQITHEQRELQEQRQALSEHFEQTYQFTMDALDKGEVTV